MDGILEWGSLWWVYFETTPWVVNNLTVCVFLKIAHLSLAYFCPTVPISMPNSWWDDFPEFDAKTWGNPIFGSKNDGFRLGLFHRNQPFSHYWINLLDQSIIYKWLWVMARAASRKIAEILWIFMAHPETSQDLRSYLQRKAWVSIQRWEYFLHWIWVGPDIWV